MRLRGPSWDVEPPPRLGTPPRRILRSPGWAGWAPWREAELGQAGCALVGTDVSSLRAPVVVNGAPARPVSY